jgi:putative sterol carrier protein
MDVAALLQKLPAAFNTEAAGDTDAVIQFNITQPHFVTIKGGKCVVGAGSAPAADVTLTIADDDLVGLLTGELNGMTAFMTGKLQIEGDLMLAQRITGLFDSSKLH